MEHMSCYEVSILPDFQNPIASFKMILLKHTRWEIVSKLHDYTEKNFFFNLNQISKMENINTSKYGLNQLNQDILFSLNLI
jgi:hypothetical protein